ncbi:MAG: DUF115 domain-containing protein [Lachnospiraceae bacterium]|nr:DUF115 domain-containing protein [Lachnospiraceae bacterium]
MRYANIFKKAKKIFSKNRLPASRQKINELEFKIESLGVKLEYLNELGVKLEYLNELGVKIDYLNNKLENFQRNSSFVTRKLLTTFSLHQQAFSKFKNIHIGRDVAIVGCGPTLNKFLPSHIDNYNKTIFISTNRAFLKKEIIFNYLFSIDYIGIIDFYEEFFNYPNAIKFIGNQDMGKDWQIPSSLLGRKDVLRYNTTINMPINNFALDIDSEPIYNSSTVSLQAMQFALFTLPKRIFLIGIDCTPKGHFIGIDHDLSLRGESIDAVVKNAIFDWHRMKEFIDIYYPHVEVISINPVSLKGLFNDYYTA